jgi:DnaJ-class molecular chaperone
MRDPYQVLGVPKGATQADIKSAFRKLAKKYHPDQSKEVRAKERFSEANTAYEILGDEKKRAAFDRGEIDAEGKPRAPNFEGFGFGRRPGADPGAGAGGPDFRNFSFGFGEGGGEADILSELFGARSGRGARAASSGRGEDLNASVSVPLATIANGGAVRVVMPNGKTLDVNIPAGIEDGKAIRLRGQGQPGRRAGHEGDAIVTVRYEPHPVFKVEGRDLRADLPIALYEAVLGAKVRAPTLQSEVEVAIPAGANSGRVLRLRGKGLPGGAEHANGDILLTLKLMLPAHGDPELTGLMRRWRDEKPYDPRK